MTALLSVGPEGSGRVRAVNSRSRGRAPAMVPGSAQGRAGQPCRNTSGYRVKGDFTVPIYWSKTRDN
ncbi:hypothetical protein RC1_3375 [Rhodospirillum centenum SW]|uniref:Uncharacterized protein n=1 Tax=Rhodospirillum centenum (strain ATCC 51521 / SW) TaxID=414684 RepID=B6IWR1_RHOCS|nr:hypothetical protein RC1_3375 [Rhodospirillum centenum SW]